jgi:hypothetical protein
MISCNYGATVLAIYVCQFMKIRIAIPDVNTIGNRIIFDDIVLVLSVPDTTPPTLTSCEDNKSNGHILVNEPVTCTVAHSEPMSVCS